MLLTQVGTVQLDFVNLTSRNYNGLACDSPHENENIYEDGGYDFRQGISTFDSGAYFTQVFYNFYQGIVYSYPCEVCFPGLGCQPQEELYPYPVTGSFSGYQSHYFEQERWIYYYPWD